MKSLMSKFVFSYLTNEKYVIAGILNLSEGELMNLNCREPLVLKYKEKSFSI